MFEIKDRSARERGPEGRLERRGRSKMGKQTFNMQLRIFIHIEKR